MLAFEGFIRIVVIVFLEIISFDRFDANSLSCYDMDSRNICYFQPIVANTPMTWDDAWKVCKENNATLPVIENRLIAETLSAYLEKSKTSFVRDTWLAGREILKDDWQWLNRKLFGQQSNLRDPDDRNVQYNTNAVITGRQFKSHYPNRTEYYICKITDSKLCQNKSTIPWENGCLFVNNDEKLNLVDSRNRCLDIGGDLATFETDEQLSFLQQKPSLIFSFKHYWIGLRRNWWIWNNTDTSKEIKYSNWLKYENLLKKHCLYISVYEYKWNQDDCNTTKRFLCQTVNTTAETQRTDDENSFSVSSPSSSPSPENDIGLPKETLIAIIGSAIACVIVAVIIVVLVIVLKTPRNRGVSHRSDKEPTIPHEMSTHPIENKSIKSKTIEGDEMSNHYAEITRVDDHENDDECRDDSDEPQPGIVYAALEFDANKAIYEEPVVSSQRKQEGGAPAKTNALNKNDQRRSFAMSPTQAAEGTIYANM